MNKTIHKPSPGFSAGIPEFNRQSPSTNKQQPQSNKQLPPPRGNAAKRALVRATEDLGAIPSRRKRGGRHQLPPVHRNYLMEGGCPAVASHADPVARARRRADLEQKHLDDTDALLQKLTSRWEPQAHDAKALRAELRPKTDHLFAGARTPLPKPASRQPVARTGRIRRGITKSPAPVKPRSQTAAEASPQAKALNRNG